MSVLGCVPVRRDVPWRNIAGNVLLVHPEEGIVYPLNQVATRIWMLIDGTKSVAHILKILLSEFKGGANHIRDDTLSFLFQLEEANLLKTHCFSNQLQPRRAKSTPLSISSGDVFLGQKVLMNRIDRRAFKKRIPIETHFALTYRCNQNCLHCYSVAGKEKMYTCAQRELTYSEITKVLDDLAELGGFYITFSGGEVLVREDFFEIAQYAKEKGFAIQIFTNGTKLDQEQVQRLTHIQPLFIQLSLFSDKAGEHDRITRVPGSFMKLMQNIQLLKRQGLRICLRIVVMDVNRKAMRRTCQFVTTLGITYTFTYAMLPRINGNIFRPLRHQLDAQQLERFFEEKLIKEWEPNPLHALSPKKAAECKSLYGPGGTRCAITPYGDVLPSVTFRMPMGNVRETSFKEIWAKPPKWLKELLSIKTYADLPACRTCKYVAYCNRCLGDMFHRKREDWRKCYKTAFLIAKALKETEERMRYRSFCAYGNTMATKQAKRPYSKA